MDLLAGEGIPGLRARICSSRMGICGSKAFSSSRSGSKGANYDVSCPIRRRKRKVKRQQLNGQNEMNEK